MMADDFFSSVREWSRWKHTILQKYLRVWCYKLGSRSPVLMFVDGCAGAGRYADGRPGSPLIAAEMNNDPSPSKRWALKVVAFEQDADTFLQLQKNLEPWTSRTPPLAFTFDIPFAEGVAKLEPLLRDVPTLYFIDPYGMADLTPAALAPILDRRRDKTELIMRYDPRMLLRWEGWLVDRDRNPRGQKLAVAFRRRLESLGVDVAARMASAAGGSAMTSEDEYLARFTARFHYTQMIAIKPSFDAAPKYSLFFGTDSPDGAAHMNDIVGTTEDELWEATLDEEEERSGQGSLFHPERPRIATSTDAEATMLEYLQQVGPGRLSWIEIRAYLAFVHGSQLRDKHHRLAAEALRRQGLVTWTDVKLERTTIVELVA